MIILHITVHQRNPQETEICSPPGKREDGFKEVLLKEVQIKSCGVCDGDFGSFSEFFSCDRIKKIQDVSCSA